MCGDRRRDSGCQGLGDAFRPGINVIPVAEVARWGLHGFDDHALSEGEVAPVEGADEGAVAAGMDGRLELGNLFRVRWWCVAEWAAAEQPDGARGQLVAVPAHELGRLFQPGAEVDGAAEDHGFVGGRILDGVYRLDDHLASEPAEWGGDALRDLLG